MPVLALFRAVHTRDTPTMPGTRCMPDTKISLPRTISDDKQWSEPMNDTRFDGRKIYKYASASQAVYDIRGKYIHKANSASQPLYEIRGDYIHKAHSASQPEFEIRGDRIHKAHSASQALYEIR
jgi:hypothetical protein